MNTIECTNYLARKSRTLAYELGLTDGWRHAKGRVIPLKLLAQRKAMRGYERGFNEGRERAK